MIDALRLELEEVLHHLYDPGYQFSSTLYQALKCPPGTEPAVVQARVLQAIEGLKPSEDEPPGNRLERAHAILHFRFTLGLPQDEVAELLHISVRTLQRAQREAIHTLALELAQIGGVPDTPPQADTDLDDDTGGAISGDWHVQAEAELASLRASAPDRTADVLSVLQGVLELEEALTAGPDHSIKVRYVQANLAAGVHPSALRQTIIGAVSRIARNMASGAISIYAGLENAEVKITLTAITESLESTEDLTREFVVPPGGSVRATVDGSRVFIEIRVPSIGEVLVLAVDDNQDMLHYYRRCVAGTRYRIIEAASGREALEIVNRQRPHIILLDVMLPDVDGWELLMQLHEDLQTRAIPVIVCTVVREADLAHSLGAAHFLPKPVAPQQLVSALDRVLHPEPEVPERGLTNTAAAC